MNPGSTLAVPFYWPVHVEAVRRLGNVGPCVFYLSSPWEARRTVCRLLGKPVLYLLSSYREVQEIKLFPLPSFPNIGPEAGSGIKRLLDNHLPKDTLCCNRHMQTYAGTHTHRNPFPRISSSGLYTSESRAPRLHVSSVKSSQKHSESGAVNRRVCSVCVSVCLTLSLARCPPASL